jgi:hypothetical protein
MGGVNPLPHRRIDMQALRLITAVALATVWPMVAAAQTTTPPQPTDQTTTTTTTTTTTQPTDTTDPFAGQTDSHWLGSAFIGGDFGSDNDEGNVDFGGSVGYLWRGVFGGEFLANFSPDFSLEPGRSALVNGTEPWINSYMGNAILALPMGAERRFQPYVSGGIGVLTLRSDTIGGANDSLDPDDSRFGGNIGVGAIGFMENIGIRGDLRWFGAATQDDDTDPNESPEEAIGSAVLSDLRFWRANIGLAFRW